MRKLPALTLVELLVVMGLIAVLTLPFVISFRTLRSKQALTTASENLANVLRTAHVYSREEKDAKSWGIRFVDTNVYSLVSGDPANFQVKATYMLEQPVVFATSFGDIWFGQSTGDLKHDTEIQLVVPSGYQTKIEISKAGIINNIGL